MEKDSLKLRPSSPPVMGDYKDILKQAKRLAQTGRSAEALDNLNNAEGILLSDKSISPNERDLHLSRVHINRGITYKNMRNLEMSAKCYEKAMVILDRIGDGAEREKFSVELNLAILRTRLKDKPRAEKGFINAEKLAMKFNEAERRDLLSKVITNRAQLYLEFQDINKARELLDRLAAFETPQNRKNNAERKARVSAQLGQLIVKIAEQQESRWHANEHYNQAIKFFNEAGTIYEELGLIRDAVCQRINRAEALIAIDRIDEAARDLENIYSQLINEDDRILESIAISKLLIVAILKSDDTRKEKWIEAVINSASELPKDARSDFLENLESRLRWLGSDDVIGRIQKLREMEELN